MQHGHTAVKQCQTTTFCRPTPTPQPLTPPPTKKKKKRPWAARTTSLPGLTHANASPICQPLPCLSLSHRMFLMEEAKKYQKISNPFLPVPSKGYRSGGRAGDFPAAFGGGGAFPRGIGEVQLSVSARWLALAGVWLGCGWRFCQWPGALSLMRVSLTSMYSPVARSGCGAKLVSPIRTAKVFGSLPNCSRAHAMRGSG